MAINSFDDDSVKRIGRSVRLTERSPLQSPTYRRKNRSRSTGGFSSITPFLISIKKSEQGNQVASISSGRVFIDTGSIITTYDIESNLVSLESEPIGTVYIYLKVPANWQVNNSFIGYPILTIKTGEGIANSNFSSNSVKNPVTDFDNYFFEIGNIDITEKNGIKKYKVNQLAINDSFFKAYTMNSFTVNRIFSGKASDFDDDINYELWVNGGQVVLPDGIDQLTSVSETISKTETKYVYLEIQGTQNENGGWSDFSANIVFESAAKSNTDDFNYFLISLNTEALITKGFDGNFESGGRIY